jgi:hypothetical protein
VQVTLASYVDKMQSILLVSFMMLEDKRNDLDTPISACSKSPSLHPVR